MRIGDRVIPCTPQLGTWRARANIASDNLVKVPADWSLKRAAAASVNPPTAIRMLLDNPSDGWVMQNCANSGVGESVVQVARHLGIKSVNFVRDKGKKVDVPGWGAGSVEERLRDLGADEVCEYKDLDVKGGEVGKMIKAKVRRFLYSASFADGRTEYQTYAKRAFGSIYDCHGEASWASASADIVRGHVA